MHKCKNETFKSLGGNSELHVILVCVEGSAEEGCVLVQKMSSVKSVPLPDQGAVKAFV